METFLPNFFFMESEAFFIRGFSVLKSKSARGFANRADAVATAAMVAVVVTTFVVGKNFSAADVGSYNTTQTVPWSS